MTLLDIIVKNYSYFLRRVARKIDPIYADDIVGDWFLDIIKRGDKYIESLFYPGTKKLNFIIVERSIFQSWYNHHQSQIKHNVVFTNDVPTLVDWQYPTVFSGLSGVEFELAEYIVSGGINGKLPEDNLAYYLLILKDWITGKKPKRKRKKYEKRCKICGEVKPLSEFPKNKKSKDGTSSYCKVCMSRRTSRKFRKKNL